MSGKDNPSPMPPLGRNWQTPNSLRTAHPTRFQAVSAFLGAFTLYSLLLLSGSPSRHDESLQQSESVMPLAASDILDRCAARRVIPETPSAEEMWVRSSDRYEPGTRSTLIKNVTLWTGARNGTEIVYGDVLLEKGIVQGIGSIPETLYAKKDVDVFDAEGAWVTPGLVDLHSHVGLVSAPLTSGALERDSPNGPILPWLRSIDALNTHDASFAYAVAGGVTTVQVLPDNGRNSIGGQAFMIKLRKTSQRTPTSMVIEPPYQVNGTKRDPYEVRWRHLMMSCGESTRAYGNRMDNMWALRAAFAVARGFHDAQDAFCARAEAGLWDKIGTENYPEDYRWEALVDVLRGRVKVSVQCDEAVDLDAMIRLSQEFKIPIASFHSAHEAYLIPETMRSGYAGVPIIALSADNSRYSRESFRGSEFAARILVANGFPVAMKSNQPTHNSRYLIFEAQQAHYYGLPPNMALASVTSVPAAAAGLAHRIGILREGADADLVLWDSHPLQLGATPRKVWIDGILQVDADRLRVSFPEAKNTSIRHEPPKVPSFDVEKEKAIRFEGLPSLRANKTIGGRVAFRNVRELYTRKEGDYANFGLDVREGMMDVIVERGRVTCVGRVCEGENADVVMDLHGGAIVPGMMSFGSSLGLDEMESEPSTGDGLRFDSLKADTPRIIGDVGGVVRASDALQFGTRNALVAHRAGVTYATTSFVRPAVSFRGGFIGGLSTTFRTGANHGLDRGAMIKPVTALHVTIGRQLPGSFLTGTSISTEIATLRHLLLHGEDESTETGKWFKNAANGDIPLVIDVSSADIMASLIRLKDEVEEKRGSYMRMVFSRATEAHLLADEIAHSRIGVILSPLRQFPWSWDERRVLPGPPFMNDTALTTLLSHGVLVGIGSWDSSSIQSTRFDLGWAVLDSDEEISKKEAYELMTTNLEKILDLEGYIGDMGELVAYEGGSALEFTSKPIAILSPAKALVEVL